MHKHLDLDFEFREDGSLHIAVLEPESGLARYFVDWGDPEEQNWIGSAIGDEVDGWISIWKENR